MESRNFIIKNEKIESAEDYSFLRRKGLEYVEKLSHKIWTDFNIHDPGITILEVLCYAITDVAYRTSFEIKDLLTTRKDQGGIKEMYTARQILTCNPVTINDFRKILIDAEGVKNAWLQITKKQEQPISIDCKKSILTFESNPEYKELVLDGLFDITLELDNDLLLGDLNDYSFDKETQGIGFTFNFPGWDFFFDRGYDPEEWSFESYEYDQYHLGTKIHEAKIKLKSKGSWLILPVPFVLKGRRNLENEEKVKSFLTGGGSKEIYEAYTKKVKAALNVVKKAREGLFEHRNLCEDFISFRPVNVEEIALCANIQLSSETDIEKIYARILFEVGRFLAPHCSFYSLDDLLNAGTPTEEIFEGPFLNHGFIKEKELEKSELPKRIHISDIINIIMDIEGVLAIDKIQLGSYQDGIPENLGERWCLILGEGRAPRLRANLADLTFFKGLIPYNIYDWDKINFFYEELIQTIRTAKLRKDEYDLPILKGSYLDIPDYISIQEEFPLVYGVGKKGIPGIINEKRKAQAKQLKAFLTLFDQLLANYLAQLRHLKDIFSYSEDIDRTYFFQLPFSIPDADEDSLLHMKEGVPEIFKLVRQFTGSLDKDTDIDKFKKYADKWKDFAKDENNGFVTRLAKYTEDTKTFEKRRNQFLDHLMARFAEQFTDYTLLMYSLDNPKASKELIEDKTSFLQDYKDISAFRGRAFNYRKCDNLWTTETEAGDNVSGYKKRLSRLTGIKSYDRRTLLCDKLLYKVFKGTDKQWYFRFGELGDVLLKSEGYTRKHNCLKGIDSVFKNGITKSNYEKKIAEDSSLYYNLIAQNNEIIGTSPMFTTEAERDEKLESLVEILEDYCNVEGFHLVEHILLRPKDNTHDLMPVCVEPGCKSCLGYQDPYSFRITLVMPFWIKRFSNMNFRHHFEFTARLEAPAHVHVKICWVGISDMGDFEEINNKWLKALCQDKMTAAIQNKMVKVLSQLKSVYPEGTLHDCAEDEIENPIILGQTNIGSAKSE